MPGAYGRDPRTDEGGRGLSERVREFKPGRGRRSEKESGGGQRKGEERTRVSRLALNVHCVYYVSDGRGNWEQHGRVCRQAQLQVRPFSVSSLLYSVVSFALCSSLV